MIEKRHMQKMPRLKLKSRNNTAKASFEQDKKPILTHESLKDVVPFVECVQLRAKASHNVGLAAAALETIGANTKLLTPRFLNTYPLQSVMRDVRESFETSEWSLWKYVVERLDNRIK
jgi:hypothetical protein